MEDKTTDILNKYLDSGFRVSPMAPAGVAVEDVRNVEAATGIKLPEEFVLHVTGRFPGLYVEVKEDVWPRPQLYDVGPAWSFMYGLYTLTPSPDSEDWMRLQAEADRFLEDTGIRAVPILKVIGDPDPYCVTEGGSIARYSHDEGVMVETGMDFWELYDREIKALRERKDEKIALQK